MTPPEFARPRRLDTLGPGETVAEVEATPAERAALARRFGLVSVERLAASYVLRRDAAGVIATGHVSARVEQACVATGEPCPAVVEEDFGLRFAPEGQAGAEEVELSGEALDTMFYAGSAIDLGEAAAETMVLALDPFPRSAQAAEALKAAGVRGEEEAGAFGALAGLKDLLAGKS